MSKNKHHENDEYVMYVIVNNNLKMGKGKIASQCMHSACHTTRILEREFKKGNSYDKWVRGGEAKVVLKSDEKDMIYLIDKYQVDSRVKRNSDDAWCTFIRDHGRTQIAADSLTTLCFRPILKSAAPVEIKRLKCL